MRSPEIALGDLDFGWASHRAALGWWSCLFRRPVEFDAKLKKIRTDKFFRAVALLGWHGFGYFLALAVAGRYFLTDVVGLPPDTPDSPFHTTFGQAVVCGITFYWGTFPGLALARRLQGRPWTRNLALLLPVAMTLRPGLLSMLGLTLGLAGGIAGQSTGAGAVAISAGLAVGLASAISIGVSGGLPSGIAYGLALGLVGGIAMAASDRQLAGSAAGLAGGLALGVAVGNTYGLAVGLEFGISFGATYQLTFLRAFYLPLHLVRALAASRGRYSPRSHLLLADQCIHLQLPFLDTVLVGYHESSPGPGAKLIDRLIDGYPSQRGAALRAKAIVVVRKAARLAGLDGIGATLEELPTGKAGFLAETPAARRLAVEVAAAAGRLEQAPRGYLRAPYAESLVDKIEIFRHQIAGFQAPLSTELRQAAERWLEVARARLLDVRNLAPGAQFLPVFRAGEAIEREIDAYVPRRGLLIDLEEQIQLAGASSGLVLIGRRRTGKSTLLHNLAAQLQASADVAVISMQSARAFTSVASLQRLLRQILAERLPEEELPPAGKDLAALETLLAAADQLLARQQRKLVLAIDEYEGIDLKIAAGVFPEDLLALLRDSMRSHRRIFWLFAGSRSTEELEAARWTSYFVSTRLLEMPLFELAETRELLTEPMKTSKLFAGDPGREPRFPAAFWGEGGIEKLHAEAGGWPHLVQLLAQNAVQLVNQEGRRHLDAEFFERVCSKALSEGSVVFTELLEKESRRPGEWDYLRGFRRSEEQPPPEDPQVDRALRRRWLIAETPSGGYRLRVPLMGRWLRERG